MIGLIFARTRRGGGGGTGKARAHAAAVALTAVLIAAPAAAREAKQAEPPGLLKVLRSLFGTETKSAAPARAVRKARQGPSTPKAVQNPVPKSTVAQAGCSGELVKSAYYFSGHRTANGEAFDPQGMTVAHRTLPFGTRLTVTNPRTGQSTTVRVNDRGPFVRGVSLDLSLGAAKAIGMRGTEHVCIS